jgi:uridine phosphorylase
MDMFPILEFDPQRTAIIEPMSGKVDRPVPERGVLCFFSDLLQELREAGSLEELYVLRSEMGPHPVYTYRIQTPQGEREVVVAHPGVGAPLAVGLSEEIISLGVSKLIVCGGCGVLDRDIAAGHPLILTAAVRAEGTSYHYMPPSRESYAHPVAVSALEIACKAAGVDYRLGKTWTTDAFYRETPALRERRLAEGCSVVEMEAAAFFAMAQFREVVLGEIVYGGDLVVPEGWDSRGWNDRTRDRRLMFDLAVQACLSL